MVLCSWIHWGLPRKDRIICNAPCHCSEIAPHHNLSPNPMPPNRNPNLPQQPSSQKPISSNDLFLPEHQLLSKIEERCMKCLGKPSSAGRRPPTAGDSHASSVPPIPQKHYSLHAKKFYQQIATELILFITSEASEALYHEGRKQVKGDDIISALKKLGLERHAIICDQWKKQYAEIDRSRKKKKSKEG